ncbi:MULTISPECIES: hypothetical protein [Streptomyces]|uniref:DUF3040 domain-containing protein n=1 Tax=Streptomyces yangpuensis TaxID=1648182 RepID=A0ABY5PPT9_9ACTN|nr:MULTISPECIES: hypothetical protein [Streptomyces]MBZ9593874.1 hypothetical protein [Streptomyces erythrochromogenes]UUY45917.1 hypothetical protein NRK68_01010 [Streptomyces yangpuensis]
MTGNELTPQETAIWDQLLADLNCDDVPAQTHGARWPAAGRRIGMTLLLLAALIMLLAGSFAGSDFLAWSGVIAWTGAVLIISHHHGHGPRLPMSR